MEGRGDVWGVLQIEATADVRIIKRAYVQQLKITRAHQDTERFIALREAYETALRIAGTADTIRPDNVEGSEPAQAEAAKADHHWWSKDTLAKMLEEYVTHYSNQHNTDAKFISAASPSTILELLDKIDQLQADAARYQWLRKNGFALTGDLYKKLVPVCLFEDADIAVDRQMAIDAAMKEQL